MRSIPLPHYLHQLMIQLSKALGVKEFILFGGTAIDLLINPSTEICDLDIGIGEGKKYIKQCKKQLKLSNYQIIGKDRPYFTNMIDPVTMVFAKNNRWLLDISFMNNIWDIGQFDIESLFFRYPELDYIDRYNTLKALKEKTMRSIHGLYKENPYLLLNRIINICAKYDMNMSKNPVHRNSINVLKKRISNWNPPNSFHGKMAKIAHYSTVLKAMRRAKNRYAFIKDLIATGLLLETMPELQKLLKNLSPQEITLLEKAKTKGEIIEILVKITDPKDRQKLKQRFRTLRLREWDLEDRNLKI